MENIEAKSFSIIVLNLLAFLIMGIDKFMAKIGGRRIPEKLLFFIALVGGAAGIWLGMQLFRHKTQHKLFVFGIPLLLLVNLASYYVTLHKNYLFNF